jgi:hypothetical protein
MEPDGPRRADESGRPSHCGLIEKEWSIGHSRSLIYVKELTDWTLESTPSLSIRPS